MSLTGMLCLAPLALAQNADQNSAGPTRNQLHLRLTEPREGAQITGSSVRVAVDYTKTSFGEGQGTKFGDKNFPMPIFDVFVDNDLKQSIKGSEGNVATIDGLAPGNHTIVVLAKNISGEIIDRATVNVVTGATVADSSLTMSTPNEKPEPAPAPAPVAPPPPAYSAPVSTNTTPTADSNTLPATGSNAPATALLGLTLLAGGLLVARRTS
jgi:LPXTG-motif cell wall-anchored protein